MKDLSRLEEQRSNEFRAFYDKFEKLSAQLNSKPEVNVAFAGKDEVDVRLHATYTELTRPLTISKKIRLVFPGPTVGLVGLLFIMSFVLIFIGPYLAEALTAYPEGRVYNIYRLFFILMGVSILVYFLLLVWRRFTEIDRYTDFSARILREIYLRIPHPDALVMADNILRDILEDMGPLRGKEKAREVLSDKIPRNTRLPQLRIAQQK